MNNLSLSWIKKNHLKLINKILPEKINNNSVLIEIKSASICGSDLKILKNGSSRVKKGRTIGHELYGIIYKPYDGHYTCCVRHIGTTTWYYCDDSADPVKINAR